jgi:hypothetical protein
MRNVRYTNYSVIAAVVSALMLAGCGKDETVSVYSAPKDPPPTAATVAPVADTNAPPPGHPAIPPGAVAPAAGEGPLSWTTPPGWKQLPGNEMRFASFQVGDDPKILLSVIPLGMEAGKVPDNVNRWEGQLGLPPTPADKLDSVVKKISANGLEINAVDLSSPAGTNPPMRMLAAMTNAGGRVWFFKLSGPADVVGKQKDNFDAFIKSIKPSAGGDTAAVAPPPAQAAGPAIPAGGSMKISAFKAADDWKETPGSKAPRMIAFNVGPQDKQATLVVTRFGANGAGNFLDNINRWRGQIGLEPVTDPKGVPMSDVKAGKDNPGLMVTIDNPAAAKRMMVVMASVGSDLWFFKLTGPTETVDQAKPAFENFMKSLEFAPEGNSDEKP